MRRFRPATKTRSSDYLPETEKDELCSLIEFVAKEALDNYFADDTMKAPDFLIMALSDIRALIRENQRS